MCQNDFQPTKNFKDFDILRCKQFTVMELYVEKIQNRPEMPPSSFNVVTKTE